MKDASTPTDTAALAARPQEDLITQSRTVSLASGRSLDITESPGEERIQVRAADGEMLLSIRLTPEGPVLALSGVSLEIAAQKRLELKCQDLSIQAAGDATLDVRGSLHEHIRGNAIRHTDKACIERAREVKVEASPGGVVILANDDVDIKGERVRLNSDEPPMPLTWQEHRERQANKLSAQEPEASPPGLPRPREP